MALQTTGPISLNNVNQELGKASPYNQQVSLNDSDVRALLGVASGQIALSNAYGKNSYLNTVVYSSGTTSTFTVPTGVTSLFVKIWGGGGGSGSTGYASAAGGGGGYIGGYVDVTPGQQFTVNVYDNDNLRGPLVVAENCDGCDPENGNVFPCRAPRHVANGGMAGRVWQNSNLYMIAGGGGSAMNYAGGGGGGGTGAAPSGSTGGGGASGATGGAAGTAYNSLYPADSGTNADNNGTIRATWLSASAGQSPGQYDSCAGEGSAELGARGGDGYASGGAGLYSGGGGSSGQEGFTGVTNTAATNFNPANNSDPNYSNFLSAGIGAAGSLGGPPRIVIRY
jgi:hypothetical protein